MYKARKIPFYNKENYGEKRVYRAEEKAKGRRLSRQKNFTSNRNIDGELLETFSDETREPQKPSRYQLLLVWKEEKERLKRAELAIKSKEKPPFKCGLVHHKPPPVLDAPTLRRSNRIRTAKQQIKEMKPVPAAKIVSNRRRTRNDQLNESTKHSQGKSFAPKGHVFTAPKNLPKIEEDPKSWACIASPKSEQDDVCSFIFPVQLSPWVSKVRGSGGGSKGLLSRNEHSPNDSGQEQLPTVRKCSPENLRILVGRRQVEKMLSTPKNVEEEVKLLSKANNPVLTEEDAGPLVKFSSLHEGEMQRLEGLCLQWDSLLSSEDCQDVPVSVQDTIRSTVGQTRLLMNEKLAQFNGLLNDFKRKKSKSRSSSPAITNNDLQGFWDLVSIQINDVDMKFANLDALKWNNWAALEVPRKSPEKLRASRRVVSRNVSKSKKSAAAKKSAFQTYLAEQRKKKLAEGKGNMDENCCHPVTPKGEDSCTPLTFARLTITPVSILKCRSSQRLNLKVKFDDQGDCTPKLKKTPSMVTFRDSPIEGGSGRKNIRYTPHVRNSKGTPAHNLSSVPSLNSSRAFPIEEDLITWDSPVNELSAVRRSPRLSLKRNM